MTLEVFDTFFGSVFGNLVGGTGSSPIWVAGLIILMLLLVVLLTAHLGWEVSVLILTPGILVASFAGFIPSMSFGVLVIVLGIIWTGIILALIK